MSLFFNYDVNNLFLGSNTVKAVYMGDTQIWPMGLAPGTTFNFEYTGSVQSVELPTGKYKLQCWGAQGGTSYGSSSGAGSKGGYSEGVLTLTKTTTLYIFVGGQGSRGSSTSLVNGGWNGGGASVGKSSYDSEGTNGYSNPACGGGATDISTVTSSMSYSSGRTNRSSASLLARCIVAGGGAGGSYRYTETDTTTISWTNLGNISAYVSGDNGIGDGSWYSFCRAPFSGTGVYKINITVTGNLDTSYIKYVVMKSGTSEYVYETFISNNSSFNANFDTYPTSNYHHSIIVITKTGVNGAPSGYTVKLYKQTTSSSTSTSSGYSNKSQQGGGTLGKGQYPGTQTSAGSGGGFGYGANQTYVNYRYCAGGGGGGWYGGGTNKSDTSTSYVNYSGGGSGFVNISANASYRPSNYTGLQLDSGTTYAGNTNFPSITGGTETGHSGNGYARITALDSNGSAPTPEPTTYVNWKVQSGNWNSTSYSSAKDSLKWTSVSPGTSSSTVLRCTFSGITSITFNCVYNGESNYDYLTVGKLDTSCTRSSYGTSLQGTSGTAKDITFTCNSGEHYVEFCYSKDGSVDTSPDNAVVYIKAYS